MGVKTDTGLSFDQPNGTLYWLLRRVETGEGPSREVTIHSPFPPDSVPHTERLNASLVNFTTEFTENHEFSDEEWKAIETVAADARLAKANAEIRRRC